MKYHIEMVVLQDEILIKGCGEVCPGRDAGGVLAWLVLIRRLRRFDYVHST